MALTVNTNLSALQAYNNLSRTSASMASSMAKLSSGLRINTAADDAAGLTISEGLKSQVNGYGVAARNAQDGINMIQTADGGLGEVHSILQRMRDLAVQGANDSNNTDSRTAIKAEADELGKELDRITNGTNFNSIDLLKGGTKAFQVGAGGTANDTISVDLADVATSVGTLSGAAGATGFDVTDNAASQTTITAIDTAIKAVSTDRANLGAAQNRLNHALNIANVSSQNLAASQSHITDTDMAQEMVNYTKTNILSQAGTAMLAQANQSGQGILKLLG
ncbi:flagellin [Intrasporangium sp. YIM S08009]|uniref:flagellin N-terminal helical domain-containing protein n=1 Tax=Intrasporangium zincisolvens TaxID=3080018 RepID=UPI002B059890|nr:flagellin [Intrasporangium sp. YIM S08009]